MRDIFDQYDHPENRLTHALAWCLAEDPRLLRRFVRWATGRPAPTSRPLQVLEQSLPNVSPNPAPRRAAGLPDIWIHDDRQWSLLIESKLAAPLKSDQMSRHRRTARARGFRQIELLAIVPAAKPIPPMRQVHVVTWPTLYRWCQRQVGGSKWAGRLISYMEIAETRMADSRYLPEGSLTTFSGVPFGEHHPYDYAEAKRLLAQAMAELRDHKRLCSALPIARNRPGRPAITGTDGASVWDTLPLRTVPTGASFTRYPHLDLAIRRDELVALTVFPGNMPAAIRNRLIDLGQDGFCTLMKTIAQRLSRAIGAKSGAVPWAKLVQRRYPSRSSAPIVDARLHYDLRAVMEIDSDRSPVKLQPEWLTATYDALANKRSNLQLAIGAVFPYARCTAVRSEKLIDLIADTWIACRPILTAAQGRQGHRRRGSEPAART